MAFTVQVGGQVADCLRRKKILSTSVVRKLFNSFGKLKKCQSVDFPWVYERGQEFIKYASRFAEKDCYW